MSVRKVLSKRGPRRLLALDGGGIRGIIALEILAEMERQLAKANGQGKEFRLCNYFDYIGGTSTGAIIATALSIGMSVSELIAFYKSAGAEMFDKAFLLKRLKYLYRSGPLEQKLKSVLGKNTTLGSPKLQTLLLVVTRNATTDSPWPISNNPAAKYNQKDRPDCNLQIPLWQIVRASTAAPIYFPPEVVQWDPKDPAKSFVFVDGGVTPYNNPAFLLYRMATLPEYRLGWESGERRMMLVSVGTGSAASTGPETESPDRLIPGTLAGLPGALMFGAATDQDINCRVLGRCVHGASIDREIGDLIAKDGRRRAVPLTKDLGRAFLYGRYDPDISAEGLKRLGLAKLSPDDVGSMDSVANMPQMAMVGRAYAERHVKMVAFGELISDSD